jgi:serine/threonine protein kinase
MADHFGIGKTVGDCWTIISVLAGAEGCYNPGVYLVQNKDTNEIAVLKLLPTEAVHPSFARREITILAGLKHPNILKMIQGEFLNTPHDTPWMVTELCDKETLKDLLRKYKAAKIMVPELFVSQIFESLARAPKYCHHGNFASEHWDPVSHRNLIPGNCFIISGRALNSTEYQYITVAGDFGSAIAKSEYLGRNLTVYDLPFEDQSYVPPSGPTPSEANDVYQLSLLISCFY